jgi:hypothetical protein
VKQKDHYIFPLSNKPFHVCIGEIQVLLEKSGNCSAQDDAAHIVNQENMKSCKPEDPAT